MSAPVPLKGLHPLEYEHPYDSQALDAVRATPGLDWFVRGYNKHAVERIIRLQYTGSHLRISESNHPEVLAHLWAVCEVLNLPAVPELYLEWEYGINGFTIGVDHPIIVLTSGAIDLLETDELRFLIGHEVGHIKSRHTLYHQVADYFPVIADILADATFGASNLTGPLQLALKLALKHWSRMSEFTADRAGLLACQDLDVAARVMMKWSGMPVKHHASMNVAAFMDQARAFEAMDQDLLNKATKFMAIVGSTHPWTVLRAAELTRWKEEGDYEKVLQRQTKEMVGTKTTSSGLLCRNCGRRLEGNEKFCETCGARLKA